VANLSVSYYVGMSGPLTVAYDFLTLSVLYCDIKWSALERLCIKLKEQAKHLLPEK